MSTTAEIVKQVFDKLTEAAQAAQTTAAAALPHIIKAYMARQLAWGALSGVFLLIGISFLLIALRYPWSTDENPTRWGAVGVIGIISLLAGGFGLVANFGETIAVFSDPTGMFILSLLGK